MIIFQIKVSFKKPSYRVKEGLPLYTVSSCIKRQCNGTLWNSNYCSTRWGLYSAVIGYRSSFRTVFDMRDLYHFAYFQRVVQYTDTISPRSGVTKTSYRVTSDVKKFKGQKNKKSTGNGENWNGLMKYNTTGAKLGEKFCLGNSRRQIDWKARLHLIGIKLCV